MYGSNKLPVKNRLIIFGIELAIAAVTSVIMVLGLIFFTTLPPSMASCIAGALSMVLLEELGITRLQNISGSSDKKSFQSSRIIGVTHSFIVRSTIIIGCAIVYNIFFPEIVLDVCSTFWGNVAVTVIAGIAAKAIMRKAKDE